jgi:monoamine oxidase
MAFDIAVVGGGLSGMTAARDLKRSGLSNFVVLEARDRVGGRTLLQYPDGVLVDGGGTWVNPNQTAIFDLLHELGIERFDQYTAGESFVVIGGEARKGGPAVAPDPNFAAIMNKMADTIPLATPWEAPNAAEWDAMTMQDFLDQSDLSPAQKMIAQVTLEITYAAPLREMTLLNTLVEMKGCGGYEGQGATGSGVPQYHVVGGTAGISERIAEYLGDVVRLSSPVTAVSNWQEDQGPVRLETPSGTVEADRVIMAMGASLASQISYDPELPELRQGLHDTVDKDHCLIKTHTTYERPFWRDMNLSGGIISPDGVFTVCADVTPPETTKGVLVTLVRSPREGDGTPMSPEDRKAATIEMFAKCFGDEALSPTGWVMQDWLAETYTRGIVAVLSPGLYLKYGPALRAPTGRMIWGGTEISLFWTSYLDGAVRGGHQSALMALGALAESRSAG